MLSEITKSLVALALREDLGNGDITSRSLFPAARTGAAKIIAKEALVVCGHEAAAETFRQIDAGAGYKPLEPEGTRVQTGAVLAEVSGPLLSILAGERVALNFLQRLCGIATLTANTVSLVHDSALRILDTRKTTPGWRELEKHAVKTGGGRNHRMGLFDAVLIKNNHLDAFDGGLKDAVNACRKLNPPGTWVQVEVRNEAELREAVAAAPDAILLDNMNEAQLTMSVSFVRSASSHCHIFLEASGGFDEETLPGAARAGVDAVSMGRLTHSARAMDISLRYMKK